MSPAPLKPEIQEAFERFEGKDLDGALALRDLILDEARSLGIDDVDECLRWGQPSYISPIGTALRIGAPKSGGFALYAHCQTSVVSEFGAEFGSEFTIEGSRAVHFRSRREIRPTKLRLMIAHALQYKRTTND